MKTARSPRFLRSVEVCLWTSAAVFLGLYLGAFAEAELVQTLEGERLDRMLAKPVDRSPATQGAAAGVDASGVVPPPAWDLSGGDVLGRLRIPQIELEAIVLEGDDDTTLRRAVGHLPYTSLPGQGGTIGLAGHRDTFFGVLRKIEKGHRIDLETPKGTFGYRVSSIDVVEPEDTWVLDDGDGERLTLITCYPFHHLGVAPQRFVVHAELVTPAA